MTPSEINQSNKQFLKEKLEKLNLMLATAKKLEARIDEARNVLTCESRIFTNRISNIQISTNPKY